MKLPLAGRPAGPKTYAVIYDSSGHTVAIIKNKFEDDDLQLIVRAVNDHKELLDTLEALAQYVGGWDEPETHPCGRAAALLKKYGRP